MPIGARKLIRVRLLFTIALICAFQQAQADPSLRLISNVIWSQPETWFGGFSGAEVSDHGRQISLITDKGRLISATMIRENGVLRAMQLRSQTALTDVNGTELIDDGSDAEGLAIDQSGRAFVSFEREHRVAELNLLSGRVVPSMPNPDFANLQENSGLEALAVHPDGTLYTLPERSGASKAPFPVFAYAKGTWRIAHHIPRRGPFLPVGADFDDGGAFYLLERAASPLGFRTRIRRFDFAAPSLGERTLLTTGPGRFDNLEALSIWHNNAGQTFLTLISDDNFLSIQRTQIVEFLVTEQLALNDHKP